MASKELLSLEQYLGLRDKQDRDIRRDVDKRFDIIDKRFDSIDKRFEGVDKRFESFDYRLTELTVDVKRNEAISYNSRVRNPILPIRPIPIYDASKGLTYPTAIPKNARMFFRLRSAFTERDRSLLLYLVKFYQLEGYRGWNSKEAYETDSDSGEEDLVEEDLGADEDISLEEATKRYPRRAVETLSLLFGLDEDTFIEFEAKAALYSQRKAAVKRTTDTAGHSSLAQRPKKRVEYLPPPGGSSFLEKYGQPSPPNPPAAEDSEKSDPTRVGWRKYGEKTAQHPNGTELGSSGPRPGVQGKEDSYPGSPTNSFTNSSAREHTTQDR
ncbi:hypothetical protein SUNI508_06720 [Seiridium unicorne]|uniref:Wac domain-containing protein n=1 Tax=Seiridium unicorne TaxID=138068 RepID=A0ABR2V041_9PEZI